MTYTIEKFENFDVYKNDEKYQFRYIDLGKPNFYDNLSRYLLDYKKINAYTSVNIDISDKLTNADFRHIFQRLGQFIDYERIIDISNILDPILVKYIDNEFENKNSNLRTDKWGRIGEFIFNMILDSYFNLDCVIRKFAINTSPNMSVYGIDTIHCSLESNIMYFGESKFVKNIDDGIALINKSLGEYEKQIINEYFNISNRNFDRNNAFVNNILESNLAYTFKEFVEKANIKEIGIPIFIAHAGLVDIDEIFKKLEEVSKNSFCNLKTFYIVISFPIIDKDKFSQSFIKIVNEKLEELKNA